MVNFGYDLWDMSASSLYYARLSSTSGSEAFLLADLNLPAGLRATSASFISSNLVDTIYIVGARGTLSSYDPTINLVRTTCTLTFIFNAPSTMFYSANPTPGTGVLYLATNGFLYSIDNPATCAFTKIGSLLSGSVYFSPSTSGGNVYVVSNLNSCSTSTTAACFPFAVYSLDSSNVLTQLTNDPVSGLPLATTVTLPFGQAPGRPVVGPQDGLVYFGVGSGQGYAFDPVYGTLLYNLSSTSAVTSKAVVPKILLDSNYFLRTYDTTGYHVFTVANIPSVEMGGINVCPQGGASPTPCSQTVALSYDFPSEGVVTPTMT